MTDHPDLQPTADHDGLQDEFQEEPPAPISAASRFAHLYPELQRLARAKLRREGTLTLMDTSMLVHECYLRLIKQENLSRAERHSFMAYAAQVMRGILVDHARARQSQRRGGRAEHVPIDTALSERLAAPEDQILQVHAALAVLAEAEPRLAEVVEMHYFAGMTEIEIAAALGVSDRTVRRYWEKAKLLLRVALS
ncbi:ECF-type sigma factor [Roseateles sp. LKC17W]|uniref:ECF-type sigma factor n=1 Tax=Pelomonas margarita TaxID=3299031 RepID=A0ABW7FJF0_9BURK